MTCGHHIHPVPRVSRVTAYQPRKWSEDRIKSTAGPTACLTGQTNTPQQTPFLSRARVSSRHGLVVPEVRSIFYPTGYGRSDVRPCAHRRARRSPCDIIASTNNIRLRVNTANKSDREGQKKITGKKKLRRREEAQQEKGRGEEEGEDARCVGGVVLVVAAELIAWVVVEGSFGKGPSYVRAGPFSSVHIQFVDLVRGLEESLLRSFRLSLFSAFVSILNPGE